MKNTSLRFLVLLAFVGVSVLQSCQSPLSDQTATTVANVDNEKLLFVRNANDNVVQQLSVAAIPLIKNYLHDQGRDKDITRLENTYDLTTGKIKVSAPKSIQKSLASTTLSATYRYQNYNDPLIYTSSYSATSQYSDGSISLGYQTPPSWVIDGSILLPSPTNPTPSTIINVSTGNGNGDSPVTISGYSGSGILLAAASWCYPTPRSFVGPGGESFRRVYSDPLSINNTTSEPNVKAYSVNFLFYNF
jgi:hypothetical protein